MCMIFALLVALVGRRRRRHHGRGRMDTRLDGEMGLSLYALVYDLWGIRSRS